MTEYIISVDPNLAVIAAWLLMWYFLLSFRFVRRLIVVVVFAAWCYAYISVESKEGPRIRLIL